MRTAYDANLFSFLCVHYSEQEFANPNLVALTSMQRVVEILKIDNLKELTEEWETGILTRT